MALNNSADKLVKNNQRWRWNTAQINWSKHHRWRWTTARINLWKTTTDGAEQLRRLACAKPARWLWAPAQISLWKTTTDDAEPTRKFAFEIHLRLRWPTARICLWKLLLMAPWTTVQSGFWKSTARVALKICAVQLVKYHHRWRWIT